MPNDGVTDPTFEEILRQEARTILAEEAAKKIEASGVSPEALASVSSAQPIKINIGGKEFQFKDQEELNLALNQTFAAIQSRLADVDAHIREAQRQASAEPPEQGRYVRGIENENAVDLAKFSELLEKDPGDAIEYALEKKLGVPKPFETIKRVVDENSKLQQTIAVAQFRQAHPEYPGSPHASNVMRYIMEQNNIPFTAEGLEVAFLAAKEKGLIQPVFPQQQMQPPVAVRQAMAGVDPNQPAMRAGQAPNFVDPRAFNGGMGVYGQTVGIPGAGRGAYEAAPNITEIAENMSADQLEKLIERMHSQGVR